jgi:hypothetical protein
MDQKTTKNKIEELTEKKEKFHSYVDFYFQLPKFSGPSVYFHEKTIGLVRNSNNFEDLIISTNFQESCYATLTSWGMHKMGPTGPKLKNFKDFSESILQNKTKILSLKPYHLNEITEDQMKNLLPQIDLLFQNINIMDSGIKLVGNSKLLHHILPDLIPPMDREYTLNFFYGNKLVDSSNERKKFSEIFFFFWYICKKLDLQNDDYLKYPGFTTSIPKLIDNAIIGYNLKE